MFATNMTPYAGGEVSGHKALTDTELLKTMQAYNRQVAKRYFACTPRKLERFAPTGDLHISTKIDGQLFFLVKRSGKIAFCSPGGRVLQGGPVFEEAKKLLQRRAGDITIAGELFAIPPKGGRPRVHFVATALANEKLAPTLGFKAFDLLSEDETDYQQKPYQERLDRLETLLTGKRVSVVHTQKGTKKELPALYQKFVESGNFEGLVIRAESGWTLKLKPEISMDVVVLGYGEKVEMGKTQLKEMVVGLLREDNQYHILGFVGGGFSQEARLEWHSRLSKMQVETDYRLPNRDGALCRFVRPEIVVEVRITDLLLEDSKSNPVYRMVLDYKDGKFESVQQMPFASMIFPRLVREREDKTPVLGSVGLDQAYRHVPFNNYRDHAVKKELPESVIRERAVFTKESKNGVLLRKYVAVETQKEEDGWASFYLFSTDVSPNRKDPMKTELKVASSWEALQGLIESWKKANVKRGWVENVARAA
ncbi:MAG: hypothetical protein GF334_12830 [Candidatus Altiarchaeales archaeon]|nr:hypothetical protein [Candidatus Altiarchaeales archaeon]